MQNAPSIFGNSGGGLFHGLTGNLLGLTSRVTVTQLGFGVDVQSWMKPTQMKCEIFHINQDHVSVLPENAQLIGHSELCENSAFVIGDSVLALQGHPEHPRRAMENFIKELLLLGENPQEMECGRSRLQDEVPDA